MKYEKKIQKYYDDVTGTTETKNVLLVFLKDNEILKTEMEKINWTIDGKKYKHDLSSKYYLPKLKKDKAPEVCFLFEE